MVYSSRSCHSTAFGPYDWLSVDQPNDACKCASRVLSSAGVLRRTPRMAIAMVVMHMLLVEVAETALVVVPSLACNICP